MIFFLPKGGPFSFSFHLSFHLNLHLKKKFTLKKLGGLQRVPLPQFTLKKSHMNFFFTKGGTLLFQFPFEFPFQFPFEFPFTVKLVKLRTPTFHPVSSFLSFHFTIQTPLAPIKGVFWHFKVKRQVLVASTVVIQSNLYI